MRKKRLHTSLATVLGLLALAPWFFCPTAAAPPPSLVINEIAWGGTAASYADEWIELRNTTGTTLTLDGWRLTAADGSPDIALAGAVGPYAFYLIERTDDTTVSDIPADLACPFGTGLSNAGESLRLLDPAGTLIDTANADGGPWPNAADGASPLYRSLERVSPYAVDADANWVSNDGSVVSGLDADGNPLSATPKARNAAFLPAWSAHSDLAVHQTGPPVALPGDPLTTTLTVSNLGGLAATDVIITATLPVSVTFTAQENDAELGFTRTPGNLTWTLAELLADHSAHITLTARLATTATPGTWLTQTLTATTAVTELTAANNAAAWTTTVVDGPPPEPSSALLITGVLYDGTQLNDADEAIEITNAGDTAGSLAGWSLCEEIDGELACRPLPDLTIPAGAAIWLTRDAPAFAASFGFSATHELESWPGLTNTGDEVLLRRPDGTLADALVYGAGALSGPGWDGPPLTAYTGAGRGVEGQILTRRLDEQTGLPVPDTNTAADWLQYPDNAGLGRRVRYPGWDGNALATPLTATLPTTLVVGIAPDNAFDVISATLMRARHTISIETYTLTHPQITDILVEKATQGVDVALLLEGNPVGLGDTTLDWQLELDACRRIEDAGGRCDFMIHETADHIHNRYTYLHAKLIIVDDTWVAIGSQNLTANSLPADDKVNGTAGSRGAVVVTGNPTIAARASAIFALDRDPAHHADILRWNTGYTERYGLPVPDLIVPEPVDGISATVRFTAPLVISGTFGVELFTAPDAALRRSDALLGLLSRAGAGDEVLVEQQYELAVWDATSPAGENVRLSAYLDAARRGARVRILLNGMSYIEGDTGPDEANTATVQLLNTVAISEGLDLRAAVGNPTTGGIHNKMILVSLGTGDPDEAGTGYVHIGSINGSETASKVNREIALQIQSETAHATLRRLFMVDWCLANPVYLPLIARTYTPPPPPATYPVISEVAYAEALAAQWIELHNPTTAPIDLGTWKVGDAETPGVYEPMFTFPAGTQLGPDTVLVIAVNAANVPQADLEFYDTDPLVPDMVPYDAWGDDRYPFALRHDGDHVLLLDSADQVVDAVVWGDRTYPGVVPHPGVSVLGASLERHPAARDTDDCSADFRERYPPTPGEYQ